MSGGIVAWRGVIHVYFDRWVPRLASSRELQRCVSHEQMHGSVGLRPGEEQERDPES
jgi:hypothetical protein